jgi:hypothetical protein
VLAGHSVIEFGILRTFRRIGDLDLFAAESSVPLIYEGIVNLTVLTYAAHSEKFRSERPSFTRDGRWPRSRWNILSSSAKDGCPRSLA